MKAVLVLSPLSATARCVTRGNLSDRELVLLLEMIWLLPISRGSVAKLQQVASEALVLKQAEVQQAVEQAEHASADETRWREGKGKPYL